MSTEPTPKTVNAGKTFSIELEALPGAGYMWELAHPPGEVELVSQEVVSISKATGGNSTQRFLLVSNKAGDYSLEFILKRKWEKNPAKTTQFSIHVL